MFNKGNETQATPSAEPTAPAREKEVTRQSPIPGRETAVTWPSRYFTFNGTAKSE